MNEKPPLDARNFRPAFYVEKENRAVELAPQMRTCVGYRTKDAGDVCGKVCPAGSRFYCSGVCMENAKVRGTYRSN